MLGLALWYDDANGNGLIWCEDQGALACIRPQYTVLDGIDTLEQGQLIRCKVAKRETHRTVVIVSGVEGSIPPEDLRDILAEQKKSAGRPSLRVVA